MRADRSLHLPLIAVGVFVLGSASLGGASSAAAVEPLADAVGDCASVTASARLYYSGYNHVVTLANHCPRAVSCEVWTNVDPTPHLTLQAKSGQTVETIARVGSPSREVQAGKVCHYAG